MAPQNPPPLPPQFQPGAFGVQPPGSSTVQPNQGAIDWAGINTLLFGPSEITMEDGTTVPLRAQPMIPGGLGALKGVSLPRQVGLVEQGAASAVGGPGGVVYRQAAARGGPLGQAQYGTGSVQAAERRLAQQAAPTAVETAAEVATAGKTGAGGVLSRIGSKIKRHPVKTAAAVGAGGLVAKKAVSGAPAAPETPVSDEKLDKALDDLNATIIDLGLSDIERSEIFIYVESLLEQGTLTPLTVRQITNQLKQEKEAESTAQKAEQEAETEYEEQIEEAETRRTEALDVAIKDLESRQASQNLMSQARALALQTWAQEQIGQLGQSSYAGPQQDLLAQTAGLLPPNMQATGQAQGQHIWQAQGAVADAYRRQLSMMAPFSPVLNPSMSPTYGQPYTDMIAQLVMERGNVPQYTPFGASKQFDPAAEYYENLGRQAASQQASQQAGGGGGGDPLADLLAQAAQTQVG